MCAGGGPLEVAVKFAPRILPGIAVVVHIVVHHTHRQWFCTSNPILEPSEQLRCMGEAHTLGQEAADFKVRANPWFYPPKELENKIVTVGN